MAESSVIKHSSIFKEEITSKEVGEVTTVPVQDSEPCNAAPVDDGDAELDDIIEGLECMAKHTNHVHTSLWSHVRDVIDR